MHAPADIVIYHNPGCGTSRNTLALIREAGFEPHVVEYLKTPPTRAMVAWLLTRMDITARELLRAKEPLAQTLGLLEAGVTEDALIEAMLAHPVLINRPVVVTPWGVRLCRPSESVSTLLPGTDSLASSD